MTASEALELIDRAEHAETDPAVIRLYTEITDEAVEVVPAEWLGSLTSRLRIYGVTDEVFCEMGEAFVAEGLVPDAIDYIHEAWLRTPYLCDLRFASGIGVENVWSDVCDAFLEQMRKPEWTRSVEKPENGIRPADHRSRPDEHKKWYRHADEATDTGELDRSELSVVDIAPSGEDAREYRAQGVDSQCVLSGAQASVAVRYRSRLNG